MITLKERIRDRYYLHRYLQPLARRQSKKPESSIQDNVFIFSQPRSGSTWLAELLCTIPKSAQIDEPLWRGSSFNYGEMPANSIGRCKETREMGFYYYQPIPQDAEWQEAEQFFKKLFKVELPNIGLFMETEISQLLNKECFVFKFCYGNLLLPWLIDRFNIRPIVLVRHPCAVVRSQLSFWNSWQDPRFGLPEFKYNEYLLRWKNTLDRVSSPEGYLSAFWALNLNLIENHPYNNQKWLTVSYESLYSNFDSEIVRIFKWLERPIPELIFKAREKPSKSTLHYSINHLNEGSQIDSWTKVLSNKQIDDIMEVVSSFDIKTYNRNQQPNLSVLYGK